MKKKINLLITISILGLVALSIIQGYLINNTYKLKKDAFISEVKRSIAQIESFSPALDSLSDFWQDNFISKLTDYKFDSINKESVINGLEFIIDSINKPYKKEYQKELIKNNIPYGIKFHKEIKEIILLDSIQNDTLFDIEKSAKKIILGDSISDKNALKANNTVWQSSTTSNKIINGENKEVTLNLVFQIQDKIDIEGWKNIVFKQMQSLLLFSVLIFIIVIGLLYYSIKSLITQKKIADIKTDFVNNITHELKTPLATLTLATKMLKNEELKQQPQFVDNTVNTIERQNKRLQKLIDQVLNNSLGYAEIKLQKETVNIKNYVTTILNDFQLSVTDKNVSINHSFKIEQQNISIDKFYITTAILNTLENAIKYNDNDVEISCIIESNTKLKISIADNGIGIPEKDQNQIFEKFYRSGNKEIHNVKGLGLGLYYTNQIIKAHGGYIELKSKKDNGSTFTLVLPFN